MAMSAAKEGGKHEADDLAQQLVLGLHAAFDLGHQGVRKIGSVPQLVAPHLTVVRFACNENGGSGILLLGTLSSKATRGDSSWTPQPHAAPIWRAPPEDKPAKGISASIPARRNGLSAPRVTRRSAPPKARPSIGCALRQRPWPSS